MSIPPDLKDRVAALEAHAPHVHPAVQNLFAILPAPEAEFSTEQRREFLIAARSLFTLIYGGTDHIEIIHQKQ